MRLTLEIWRQESPETDGQFVAYQVDDASAEMSLLELLDRLNDQLVEDGQEPVAFDSDCREGICGTCGITVNDQPHGPVPNTPSCRQHLRSYQDGDHLRLEPFRSNAFPVLHDLIVDRSALDRIIASGGFIGNLFGGLAHYSSGPAGVVYGSGYVTTTEWFRVGFMISVVNIVIWTVIGGAWMKLLGMW